MKPTDPRTPHPATTKSRAPRRALLWSLGVFTLAASLAFASLAPASQVPPQLPEYPERTLDREWRGHRPDLNVDHMFRSDMPRRGSFQDAFRRPR